MDGYILQNLKICLPFEFCPCTCNLEQLSPLLPTELIVVLLLHLVVISLSWLVLVLPA